jgi:type II secretory pathway pseudopilin PulG
MPGSGYNKEVRDTNVSKGMTLLEVGLAISLGLILAAATAFAYNSAKEAAGDSRAAAKVGDLQAMVEASYSTRGYYPDAKEAQDAWGARRQDANLSPWGGAVVANSDSIVNGLYVYEENPADIAEPLTSAASTREPTTTGGVPRGTDYCYYIRLALPGQATVTRTLADLSQGTTGVSCRNYAIAISKHYRRWYFMRTTSR